MNIKNRFVISNDNSRKLCVMVFKILNCNALWLMKLGADSSNVLVTDHCILTHYLDKKYYLQDTPFDIKPNDDQSWWKITLGTDSEVFSKNGFLHDLYKMFDIEEYVSIKKK